MSTRNLTTLFLLLAFTFNLIGCGGSSLNPFNPPAVHASGILPNCDGNGACGTTVIHAWGYCQFSTYQTAKTFIVAVEIGINSNAPANDMTICTMPFAFGGGLITSINGNSNYTPWTANLSSAFIDVRSCTVVTCDYPVHQEHIAAQKYTIKGAPQSVPFSANFIAAPIPSAGIMFVVNDDLANAKPTTINVAFSGTFQ